MNSTEAPSHSRWPLWAVALIALMVGSWMTRDITLWVDSVKYAEASVSLLEGKGFMTPCFHWWDTPDASNRVPLTAHPPGLSAIYAMFGGVSRVSVFAAQLTNVLMLVLTALFSLLIARRLANQWVGFAVGLAVATCYPLAWLSGLMMAESLTAAMMLGAVWCLVNGRRTERKHWWWLGAGLFASVAITSRYAAVALGPILFWEALVVWRRSGCRRASIAFALAIVPPVLTIAGLWARNLVHTGTLRGFYQPPLDRPLLEAVSGVTEISLIQFGIWFSLSIRTLVVLVLISVPGAIGLAKLRNPEIRARFFTGAYDVVPFTCIWYIITLVVGMIRYQPKFEERFAAPYAPLLLIGVCVLIANGYAMISKQRWAKSARLFALMSIVFILGLNAHTTWTRSHQDVENNRIRTITDKLVDLETFQWVKQNSSPEDVMLSNRALSLIWMLDTPSMEMPCESHNSARRNPDDMLGWIQRRLNDIKARYLVLLSDPEMPWPLPARDYGEHVAALSRGEMVNPGLEKVVQFKDGVVWRLIPKSK